MLDTIAQTGSTDKVTQDKIRSSLRTRGFTFGAEGDRSPASSVMAQIKKPVKAQKKLSLVCQDQLHPLSRAIQSSLRNSQILFDVCNFDGDLPQGQDLMVLVDFAKPYLYNITEGQFRAFANQLSSFKGSMIWVTPSAQMNCRDPNSSMILGMARTLRAELKKDLTVVEINADPSTFSSSSTSLLKIYQGLSTRVKEKLVDADYEYAIVNGEIKIPRLQWTTKDAQLDESLDHLKQTKSDMLNPNYFGANPTNLLRFRSNATYLLVGGLGGLGRVISRWMVENGARHIIFLSRSAKQGPETSSFFDELRSMDCGVSAFAGSVTKLSDVEAAVKQAMMPVAGIMQMSAVMRVCGAWTL